MIADGLVLYWLNCSIIGFWGAGTSGWEIKTTLCLLQMDGLKRTSLELTELYCMNYFGGQN